MRSTFEIGQVRLAIGSPRAEVDRRLREALAAHVVEEDPEAPEAYVLGVPDSGRGLFELHHFDCPVLRARSAARQLDGLRRHLATQSAESLPGAVALRATALATSSGIVLLPESARRRLVAHTRRLADRGLVLLDEPAVRLRLSDGTLVVGPTPLDVPASARDAFAALGGDEPAQPEGSHRLRAVVVPDIEEARTAPVALRALHLLAAVQADGESAEAILDAALSAVTEADDVALATRLMSDPETLLDVLA